MVLSRDGEMGEKMKLEAVSSDRNESGVNVILKKKL